MFHQVLPSKATTADYLQYVQRLNFTDKSIAFDTTGNAGTVAKVLGAVFGILQKKIIPTPSGASRSKTTKGKDSAS